jgi:hypothetical protein
VADLSARRPATAFYCVSDRRYFLGAVGLINSLRLLGHTEPIYLLDCGLTEPQRELLKDHVTLVRDQSGTPPWLLKTIAPLAHPAEVMVLIDADMIVTRPLDELIETAGEGKLVAAINDRDRFRPDWGELLGLGPVRRGPYLSSGLVVVERELGTEVLELMDRLQDRVDFDRTFWRDNVSDYAFLYGDQDVLNAILASELVASERVEALPHRFAPTPPFGRLRVVDRRTLRCRYRDGVEPYLLHNFFRKPWLVRMRSSAYSRLLTRSLLEPDVELRLAPEMVPLRMRTGPLAGAARLSVDVLIGTPSYLHRKLWDSPRGRRGWADARWVGGEGGR